MPKSKTYQTREGKEMNMKKSETQMTSIRMPKEMHQQLQEEAGRRGLTLNAYIITCLWAAVDKKGA